MNNEFSTALSKAIDEYNSVIYFCDKLKKELRDIVGNINDVFFVNDSLFIEKSYIDSGIARTHGVFIKKRELSIILSKQNPLDEIVKLFK